MNDLIRREDAYAAIRGLTRHIDRIAAIRAIPAVQPDAAVLKERERCAKVAEGVAWWEAGDTAAMIRKGESND